MESAATRPAGAETFGWAGGALVLTATIAIAAKVLGVMVAPGARGVFRGTVVNGVETASGTLAYTLTALLVALVCGASFELARARNIHVVARGSIVALSGLILALVSPAVIERLGTFQSVALAVVTSFTAIVAGLAVVRHAETRAVGAILTLLATCGILRVVAWEVSSLSIDRGNVAMYGASRGLATAAVSLQAVSALLAAAWLGTRSRWRGRILANLAIVLAFALTWYAARENDAPTMIEAMLRASLPAAAGFPTPYLLGSIAAFLVPASVLLAGVSLLERTQSAAVVGALALALLSHGAYDVPLQALLVTASAEWAVLAVSRPPSAVRRPAAQV